MSVDKAIAVGHIPSGLFIICSSDGDVKDGFLASWVQQISFDPLLIQFAGRPGRPGYERIIEGNPFTINIIGEHDTQYMRHFWKGYEPGQGPFGEIEHSMTDNNGIVIKGAKSAIECKMISKSQPGDHEIIVCEVLGSYVNNEESAPKVHIRKSGLDY